MSYLKGYDLILRLRFEADDIRSEERAELVRNAADEIEALIMESRFLMSQIEKIKEEIPA